jgi:hypothetical protein
MAAAHTFSRNLISSNFTPPSSDHHIIIMNSTISASFASAAVDNNVASTGDTLSADLLPKRVILRIRPIPGNDTEDNHYQEYVKTFLLRCGRWEPGTSYTPRHFPHIQPCSSTHPWHIIIDMESHHFSGSHFDQLPHEIYKVERRETGL